MNEELFSILSEEDLSFLRNNSKYIELEKNTILFYQDDICKDILFLQEGEIRLYMNGSLDEEISLYTIKPGQQCIINTSSALSSTKTIGSAVTTKKIKALLTPKKIVQELLIKSPSYQTFVFSLFSLGFSSLTTLIEDIKFKRLDSRILEFLKSKKQKEIFITHEEIAQHFATSRVVISRVLKDLEKNKHLTLYRSRITI